MADWVGVAIAWIAFAGVHLVGSSSALRPRLVASLGERGFQGLYSAVVLLAFVWLIVTYGDSKHTGPLLWNLDAVPGVAPLSMALTALFLVLTVASQFQPQPAGLVPSTEKRARGFHRVTRHPGFVFFGAVALSHLLVNGFASDIVFFAGFPIWAFVGGAHLDARKRAADASLAHYYAETSLVPFAAILSGRNHLALRELPVLGLVAGVLATGGLLAFHATLFGGAPLQLLTRAMSGS